MTTWTCKGSLAGLALLALAACEDGQGFSGAGGAAPLLSARMMGGAVTLVPPEGFCIDRRSLRPGFALMARCDTLGAPEAAGDAPLGILTASFAAADPDRPLPTADDMLAAPTVTKILKTQEKSDTLVLQASGPAPSKGLSEVHWRGAALISGHLAVVALYGPTDSRATGADGQRIISGLISRTRAQTASSAKAVAATVPKKPTE